MADRNQNIKPDKVILSSEVASPYGKIFRFVEYMPNPDELLGQGRNHRAIQKNAS